VSKKTEKIKLPSSTRVEKIKLLNHIGQVIGRNMDTGDRPIKDAYSGIFSEAMKNRKKPKTYTAGTDGKGKIKRSEQLDIENAIKDISESKKLPYNLSELVDQVDYEYSTVQGASYLLPVPSNALSPYEHQEILESPELTAFVYQSKSVKTKEPQNPRSYNSSSYLEMRDVAIVALVALDLLEDKSHQGPNAIPLAIIRLREPKNQRLQEPTLSLVRNIIASHAQSLTLQGYEVSIARPNITPIDDPNLIATPTHSGLKRVTVPFHYSYQKDPFIPGSFVPDSEDDQHQVYMIDHGLFASHGLRCPLCRYEDAIAFIYAAVETPTLLHEDRNYQRFYLSRMTDAALLVKDGTTSFGHLGDYILGSHYENTKFADFQTYRACNQSKLIMAPDAVFSDEPNPSESPRNEIRTREKEDTEPSQNKVQNMLEKRYDYSAEQAEHDFWNGFCESVQRSVKKKDSPAVKKLDETLSRLRNEGLIED
jgi:hypothetical protein